MQSRDTGLGAGEVDGGGLGSTTRAATDGATGETKECGRKSWRDFFMPFGSGPRACLGQQMVQAEVAYVVVRLLQEFPHLSMEDGGQDKPFSEAKAVSLYNADGVRILAR